MPGLGAGAAAISPPSSRAALLIGGAFTALPLDKFGCS
jgi:hypothetical protein